MRCLLPLVFAAVAAAAAVDPVLMRCAMPDATVLAGIRLAQIRDTPFGRYVVAQIAGEGRDFENFVKTAGFDPRKQIDDALFSFKDGRWLVAVRGTFTPEMLSSLARASGAEVTSYGGVEVVNAMAAAASPLGRPMVFAFVSRTLALAGDEESIRSAIARRRTPASRTPGLLARRAAQVSAAYPAWFVARKFPDAAPGDSPLSPALLKDVQLASGGLVAGGPMRLEAEFLERTPQAAAGLADVVRFMTQLGDAARDPGAAPIAAALSAAQIGVEGTVVKVALPVTTELLEALMSDNPDAEP